MAEAVLPYLDGEATALGDLGRAGDMTRRRTSQRVVRAAILALMIVAIGGGASAYWSGGGDGAGHGTTGTVVTVTLSPGTPDADLYPGGQTGVELTLSNPSASAVYLSSLALDTTQGTAGFSVDAEHAECGVATLSFTTQTNDGAGWTVPAKVGDVDGTLPATLANALSMSADAADACQGAEFSVFLTAGP